MSYPPRPSFDPKSRFDPKPVMPKKRPWSVPLADFVGRLIDPVVAKQGFGQADLILHWDEIAGERLASLTEPLSLIWPPRGPKRAPDAPAEPATLRLKVATGFGLDVQHMAPLLIERVNAHLGWRCVGRITIEQGKILRRAPPFVAQPAPSDEAQTRAAQMTQNVDEEGLRAALARLGARVYDCHKI